MTATLNRRRPFTFSSLLLTVGLLLTSLSPTAQAVTATRTSAFEYDAASGLLTKEIIEPDNPDLCLVTVYSYDAYGNKTSATTRNCNGSTGSSPGTNSEAAAPAANSDAVIEARTSATTYDAQGRFPVSSSNALNQTETRTWNGDTGTVASLTGPNGLTTSWTYDSFGRATNETRADGTSTATAYTLCSTAGANCPSLAQYKIAAAQAGSPGKTVYYDMHSRAIRTETQGFDGTAVYADTQYDHLGHAWKTSRPYKTGAATVWTTTAYDTLNRPVSVSIPDDNGTAAVASVAYNGLTTVTTNAKGQTKTELKNSQGQLISVTDTLGYTITYQYDAYGNLTQTRDHLSNITTVTYDARGRKVAMNDPDQGAWTYAYDALGQLKRQRDAKAQVVSFAYDKLGRMLQRNEPDLVSTWSYDICDATLNPAGKCIGKPVKETTDNGSIRTILYDAYGRPTGELDNIDQGYGVVRSYDAYGRVDTLVYPTGLQVTNVYNTVGYLAQVKNTASQLIYWQANTLDAEGRVLTETYGNGLINTKTWNAYTGRMSQSQSGTTSTPNSLNDQSYVYDTLGNLTQRYDGVTGLNEAFGYDALNRLTSTSAQAGTGPLTQVTVTYNAIGNILTKSDVGTYTYGTGTNADGSIKQPHAVSQIVMNDGVTIYGSYTYDANGNMTGGAGRSIGWTSWNMPGQITGSTPGKSTPDGTTSSSFAFVYNASHERVKETLPDGTIVYNISPRVDTGIHVEKRIKPDGSIEYQHALYAGAYPLGSLTTDGSGTILKTRYYHKDHLGSIVAITDEAGTLVERRSYDAWGKRRNGNGTPAANAFVTPDIRHGFTGHEELDELGLIHMNGRLYDPATGRFLSADPIVQYPDDLQSYNRYSYIENNPLLTNDPSGHGFFKSLFKGVRKIVRGVVHAVKAALKNPVVRTVASIAAAVYTPGLFGLEGTFGGSVLGGFTSGLVAGRGDLGAALQGAITAGAFNLAGTHFPGSIENVVAHAAVGCASAVMGGGRCGAGALSGGFSAALAPRIPSSWGPVGGAMASAVIGGTASVLGGGKFENGAMTAAFGYLFNWCAHNGCTPTDSGLLRGKDGYGSGDFGVSRDGGRRSHLGQDFVDSPGEEIVAPIDGRVTRTACPYCRSGDTSYSGLVIVGNGGVEAKLFYVKPYDGIVGSKVSAGDPIGIAQNLQVKYQNGMTNHVHAEIRVNGEPKPLLDYIQGK